MQIVIDIPDEWKRRIKSNNRPDSIECGQLVERIWKGKILPKGHGRLIDGDELRLNAIKHKYSNNFCEEHNIDWSINLGMLNILIADAPTIIEANKEDSK